MIYQVIMQDEYNNLYHQGFYGSLKDSLKDINNFLELYHVQIKEEDLKEYPSTFNMCFDLDISDVVEEEKAEEVYGVMVRGFIFDNLDGIPEGNYES